MATDTSTPIGPDIPATGESRAVLPPIDGTGGTGTDGWGRAERRVYLELELERAARALEKLE